ncbi:hypothetical protein OCS_01365 [Ophiocordyceps sinensis CO18]|uniref:Uncharacterized protein n=1 Tax=Ophiocordyceps sinensis (strain Co18 / CGMCC 3.14243) TaxID=911162 RepID=T5AKI4_OPHSC|nr:hypothetical protein OCS_01365 [Ophiocordyceps sinensis CO18]
MAGLMAVYHGRRTKNIERMEALPEVRPLQMAKDKSGVAKELKLNRSLNFEAVMIQLTGRQAAQACDSCVGGLGPFSGCYHHEGLAKGVCGNCHYNSRGMRCTCHESNKILVEARKTPTTKREYGLEAKRKSPKKSCIKVLTPRASKGNTARIVSTSSPTSSPPASAAVICGPVTIPAPEVGKPEASFTVPIPEGVSGAEKRRWGRVFLAVGQALLTAED